MSDNYAESINRSDLIDKLTDNLPAIRAKMNITQAEFADLIGIGRQTLISIENKNSKMRWDTFLATMLVISKDPNANELAEVLGLGITEVGVLVQDLIMSRNCGGQSLQNKLWTDNNYSEDTTIRGFAPLPVGLKNSKCPKCGSLNIRGVMIMPTADEADPNIVCLDCGYWRD